MFGGETGPAMTDVNDGLGKTIMAVEAESDHAVVWTNSEDLELDFDDLSRDWPRLELAASTHSWLTARCDSFLKISIDRR